MKKHLQVAIDVENVILFKGDEFNGTADQPFSSAYCVARAAPETTVKTAQIVLPAGSQ